MRRTREGDWHKNVMRSMEFFAKEVMPEVRAAAGERRLAPAG